MEDEIQPSGEPVAMAPPGHTAHGDEPPAGLNHHQDAISGLAGPASRASEQPESMEVHESSSEQTKAQASQKANKPPASAEAMLDLATFLRSIHADVSISQGDAAAKSSAAPPALPISATVQMIDAQITSVESSMRGTIQQRLDEFRKHARQARDLPQRIDQLHEKVIEIKSRLSQGRGNKGDVVLRSSTAAAASRYTSIVRKSQKAQLSVQLGERLLTALKAVETAESHLASGDLNGATLGPNSSITAAQQATKQLSSSDNPAFSWLDDPAPKGLRMARTLSARATALSQSVDRLLEAAWKRAVRVEPDPGNGNVRITLCRNLRVYWGKKRVEGAAERSLSLQELMDLLQRDSKLEKKLDQLLAELRSSVLAKCAPVAKRQKQKVVQPSIDVAVAVGTEAGPQVVEGELEEHHFSLASGHEDATGPLSHLTDFIKFMHGSALGPARASSSSVKSQLENFSKRLAGFVRSTMLRVLESSLPRMLSVKSLPADLERVEKAASQAREAHESLRAAGIAPEDFGDEDDDSGTLVSLSRFASHAKELYFKNAIQSALEEVREKLVEDKWDTQIVELKHEVPIPALQNEPEPYPPFVDAPEDTPSPSVSQYEARIVEPEPPTLLQPPSHSHNHTPGSSATGTPREGSPGPAGTGRKPRGKAALGAARIVKPKDQLGSGPWDLDGSGLDDPNPLRSSIAGSGSQNTVIEDADEDVWDLDEPAVLAKEEEHANHNDRAANISGIEVQKSTASSSTMRTDAPARFAAASVMDLDDVDDDAWGLSAEEIAIKRASMLGAPANFSLEKFAASSVGIPSRDLQGTSSLAPAQQSIDEEDDDAWGLDEVQLNAKRASMIATDMQPLATQAQATPISTPTSGKSAEVVHAESQTSSQPPATEMDDDFDEDAWGLSAEELAAKRASMLLPAKLDFGDHPDGSTADTGTKTSVTMAEQSPAHPQSITAVEEAAQVTKPSDVSPKISKPLHPTSVAVNELISKGDSASANTLEESSLQKDDAKADLVENQLFEPSPEAASSSSKADDNSKDREDLSPAPHPAPTRQVAPEPPSQAPIVKPTSPLHGDAEPTSLQVTSAAPMNGVAKTEEPLLIKNLMPKSTEAQQPQPVSPEAGSSLTTELAANDDDSWNLTQGPWHGSQTSAPLHSSPGIAPRTSQRSVIDDRQQTPQTPTQEGQAEEDDAWGWDDDVEAADVDRPRSAAELITPQSVTEKCAVSSRTVFLIKHIQSLLEVIDHTEVLVGESPWENQPTEMVLHAILQELDMHSAIMPAAHSVEFTSVPTLSVQFANDCTYLAQQLTLMGEHFSSHDRKDLAAQVESRAQVTNLLGKQCFEAQIAAQEDILEQSLAEADGFSSTNDPQRYAMAERAIKQVLHVLRSLAKGWQPILTRTAFLAAMGRLVDFVLMQILGYVEDLEDISEVESEKLAVLYKMLGPLEEIFVDEATQQTSVALFVPSWFKASYLSEILTGSLVDIEFLYFEAGALIDYSKVELTKLIKALFSDTPNRAKLLHRIETTQM